MTEEFRYEMELPRQRYSDEQLLASLAEFSRKRKGKYFGLGQYDTWPGRLAASATMIKRFGSWNDALKRAGLEAFGQKHEYDSRELMDILRECWRELKRRPTVKLFNEYTKRRGLRLSEGPYRTRWGSLKRACQRIHDHQRGKLTDEQLLAPTNQAVRMAIPKRLRWEVLQRDNFTCVKCGRGKKDGTRVEVEVDHIKPYSKGGTLDKANLQTLCFDCNRGKADRAEHGG